MSKRNLAKDNISARRKRINWRKSWNTDLDSWGLLSVRHVGFSGRYSVDAGGRSPIVD